MTTLLRQVLAAVAVVIAVSIAGTGVAFAHASLVSTNPLDGRSVPAAPEEASVTFSEPVSIDLGGLAIRDSDGDRVDEGISSVDAAGSTVSVGLPGDLGNGTYVATYRVLSADGHPVSGSFLFGIGSGPLDRSATVVATADDSGWEVAGAVARFVTYLSALLAAGVAFFLAFLHDQRPDRWKLVPVVRVSAVSGLIGVTATIVVQAALLTGRGVRAAIDADVLRSVISDRLGWSAAVLLVGLAATHLSTDTDRLVVTQILAFYGSLAVVGSFALWGHDTEAPYRWLSTSADVVHVGAAALWLGGLVGLVLVLRRRAPHPVASTAAIVGRFSLAAGVSVIALVVAGGAMAWIESGSPRALWATTYGRLVLVKIAITLSVLAMAAVNRFRLVPAIIAGTESGLDQMPALRGESGDAQGADRATKVVDASKVRAATRGGDLLTDEEGALTDAELEREEHTWRWFELRRMVAYEAMALVAVLGFTAVLANVTPARTAFRETMVVNLTQPVPTGTVNLVVTPAVPGANTVHVQYADPTGRPVDVAKELTVQFALPERDLAPITRTAVVAGSGHFVLEGPALSVPGTWTITLAVRTGDFTEQRSSFEVPISR